MKVRSIWIWVGFLLALRAVSAHNSTPVWLQGRASDTNPGPPTETSSTIDSLCERPRNVSEFVRNIKVVWNNKLLIQPDFFRDKSLMCFLGGVSTRRKESAGAASASRRSVTIILDESIFPHATVEAQILLVNEVAVSVLPARIQYTGILSINFDGASGLKFKDVRNIFGPNFIKRSAISISGHGAPASSTGGLFISYLYPGDDPDKYGEAELPQLRFLLKDNDFVPYKIQGYDPPDSDVIGSIFVLERANRRQK